LKNSGRKSAKKQYKCAATTTTTTTGCAQNWCAMKSKKRNMRAEIKPEPSHVDRSKFELEQNKKY
jgi:hypothetical protein